MSAQIIPATADGFVAMNGPCMAPTLAHGEWVRIDPSVTAFTGEGVYLVAFDRTGSVPQLKRLAYRDGVLTVVSDNPAFPPFPAPDNLLIGGKQATN